MGGRTGRAGYIPPPEEELRGLYWDDLLGMQAIADQYEVGIGTICKWLHEYGIPTRPKASTARMKIIRGLQHQYCQGVLHPDGEWLPIGRFHEHTKRGKLTHRRTCAECDEASGKMVPFVPFKDRHKAWLRSIVNRLGTMESCRRLGVHNKTLRHWQSNSPPTRLRRKHAKKIVLLMRELRVSGEVRHRDSIHYGSTKRGAPEKLVTQRRHLYRPHGDDDTANKRRRLTTS
jgi:hypothetical protein